MSRTALRLLTAFALVAGATLATAAEPADPKADPLKDVRELLARIDQRLDVQNLANAVQTEKFKLEMSQVRTDVGQLKDDVARLRRELADLRSRSSTAMSPSTSYYGGPPSASLSVSPAGTARVRLINTHLAEMTAVVNGTLFRVPPGTEQPVTVPAGTMTFQVYQVPGGLQTRSLTANETLTLTLYPRS